MGVLLSRAVLHRIEGTWAGFICGLYCLRSARLKGPLSAKRSHSLK